MRTILLLRGCPASGKSTWIKQHNLEPYTLSADNLRLQTQGPVLTIDGKLQITQKNDNLVWSTLYSLLEQRMERGEFVVVDATHYRSELLKRYKDIIEKYRYRAYIVDFTSVSKEECLRRNSLRPEYQKVPDEVIEKMCAVFDAEKDGVFKEISNKFKVLPFETAIQTLQDNLLYDLNDKYDKVVVFGDMHGCYEPLKEYFNNNPLNDRTEYIFVGDYLDRGIQNKETLEFLSTHYNKPNFMFLEGNHEIWLRMFCDKQYKEFAPEKDEKNILKKYFGKSAVNELYSKNIKSSEFKDKTVPQIESFNKGELRQICRKFAQFTYFKFGDKNYLVTHGGLPCLPNLFISTQEMIKGVGKYEEIDEIYKYWHQNTDSNTYQIHGHRNIMQLPIINERCINLCDTPETGGSLRVIEISKDGSLTPIYIKNNVFNTELKRRDERIGKLETKTDNELLESLNKSKWVQKKVLEGGIISYNFTRDAFYKRHWDENTCTARGLFVDKDSEQVVTRSWNKFFNWGENEDNSSLALKHKLQFPVKVFKKENGFLGLVSYNSKTDDLLVCSKSTNQGDFAQWIKDTLYEVYTSKQIEKIKEYCKVNNCTMVFECIRPLEDPHIIRYENNDLILLDIIKNSFNAEYLRWEELQIVASTIGLHLKTLEFIFNDFEELHTFKSNITENWDCKHEGYVICDQNNYMVKIKSRYYKWWKQWRAVKDKVVKGQNVKKVFTNEFDVKMHRFLIEYDKDILATKSIPDIAEEFYKHLDKQCTM